MYNIRSQINTIGYHSIKFSFLSPSEYILNMIVWKKNLVEICWIFANFPIFPWFCLFFCLFLLEFWQKRQSEGKFNKNGLNSVEKISQTIMFKIFRSKQSFTCLAKVPGVPDGRFAGRLTHPLTLAFFPRSFDFLSWKRSNIVVIWAKLN